MEDNIQNNHSLRRKNPLQKLILWLSLMTVITLLGWFTYTNFIAEDGDQAQAANTLVSLELTFDPNGDADEDGLLNGDECGNNQGIGCVDTDKDGIPDYFDIDSDNDEIPDSIDPEPTIANVDPASPAEPSPPSRCSGEDLCFLTFGDSASDPDGDYYFEPDKANVPVYNSDIPLKIVLKSNGPATSNCINANNIKASIVTRNNKYASDQSKWIDLTKTDNLEEDQLATGEIPKSFRTAGGITINDRGWSFDIDLDCDGSIYKGQNGYSFAAGALAVVNVSGGVLN